MPSELLPIQGGKPYSPYHLITGVKDLAVCYFGIYNIFVFSRKAELPQHKKSSPNAQSSAKENIREGLDTRVVPNIILTALSSQLTAHSSQLSSAQRKGVFFSPVKTKRRDLTK